MCALNPHCASVPAVAVLNQNLLPNQDSAIQDLAIIVIDLILDSAASALHSAVADARY